ncbi:MULTISPECIES: MobF family relaxase [unclassified Nonomuraea]|uniref:MobF family relaxase n=1 Tax=unclassified Nonomuraea TaxID=2593643 RepID=UPI0033D030DA
MLSIGLGYDPGYLTRQVGRGAENYYLSSVGDDERGEPPGVWSGRACAELGFTVGQPVDPEAFERLYRTFADPRDPAFGDPTMRDVDKPRLGARPARYSEESGRKPVYFLDLTFSPPKSITLLHAGLLARAAAERRAGQHEQAQRLQGQAAQVWDAVMAGNAAMLEYYQDVCGVSRAGKHSVTVEGRSSGRWVDAPRWVVASFRQHTSRNGDPQLHVHNPVLNRVPCDSDGKWRTLDSRAIHAVRPAAGALAERVMWEELLRHLPIRARVREDGHGLEVDGIADDLISEFSSRRVEVSGLLEQLRREFVARHGRQPSARALFSMAQYATKATKRRKSKGIAPTHAAELDQWVAQSNRLESGTLAEVPDRVLGLAADDAQIRADARAARLSQRVLQRRGVEQQDQPVGRGEGPHGMLDDESEEAVDEQIRHVLAASVTEVQRAKAVFSRFEVMRAINRHLPSALGGLQPGAVRQLLEELTEQALTSEELGVRLLNLPELAEAPAQFRRADGSSMYEAPCAQRFTTDDQLAVEEALLTSARQRTAPAIPSAQVEAWLDTRRRSPGGDRGLREDQAAAIAGIASSGRAVDVFEGPAGSGKSYTLAQLTGLWRDLRGAGAIGLTLSTNASYVLAEEGFERAFNIARFLMLARAGKLTIQPGSLIVVDEASMVSTTDLAAIQKVAAKAAAKVVWAGDTHQLSAPEAGGLMRVLAADAGSYALTVVERMRAQWERAASLKLRDSDASVLEEYDEHGRIIEGDREQVTGRLIADYLADRAAGKHALLLAPSNADASELSARVRAELVRAGQIASEGLTLHDGNTAGLGDLVVARANSRKINVAGTWRRLSNRDALVVHKVLQDGGLIAHMVTRARPDGDPTQHVHIPADYVSKHLELGYASTVHAAQGRTVDSARALVDSRVSHQMLYVMMTRGRLANVAYVDVGVLSAADLRQGSQAAEQLAGPDPAPGAPTRKANTVLADILDRDDATPAAIEALRGESERVTHMAHLLAIWADVVRTATRRNHDQVLAAELTPELHTRLLADPARGALYAILERAAQAGRDSIELIRQAVRWRSFDGAESVAQVLHYRLRRLMPTDPAVVKTVDDTIAGIPLRWRWSERTPRIDDGELRRFAVQLAEQMDRRTEELGRRAADAPPRWAVERLGEVPDDPLLRQEWIVRAGVVAAYGEAFDAPLPPDQLRPGTSVEHEAAWTAARQALAGMGKGLATAASLIASPPVEHDPARFLNELGAATVEATAEASTRGGPADDDDRDQDARRHSGALEEMRRASALLALSASPYRVGLLGDAELAARAAQLTDEAVSEAGRLADAERRVRRHAEHGGGPAERELIAKRDEVARQVTQIEAAAAALDRLRALRLTLEEAQTSGDEQRRRDAHAVEQAPPRSVWSLIRHQHRQMQENWQAIVSRGRAADVRAAEHTAVAARDAQEVLGHELAAVQEEIARREALPDPRRQIEQEVRDRQVARRRREELAAELAARTGGLGLLTDTELAARRAGLTTRQQELASAIRAAEEDLTRYDTHGGPAVRDLERRHHELSQQLRRIAAAEHARQHADELIRRDDDLRRQSADMQARAEQIQQELPTVGRLRPSSRARRAALETELAGLRRQQAQLDARRKAETNAQATARETAQQAAAEAPAATLWPHLKRQAAELERTWEQRHERARQLDRQTVEARTERSRQGHKRISCDLEAVTREIERRAMLPEHQREAEQAVRVEHLEHRGHDAARRDTSRTGADRVHQRNRSEAHRPAPERHRDDPDHARDTS